LHRFQASAYVTHPVAQGAAQQAGFTLQSGRIDFQAAQSGA
jgi:hypothetical protein